MSVQIQTTRDILYLALAASTVAVAFFLSLALFYLASSLRSSRAILKNIKGRLEQLWEVVDMIREKLQVGGALLSIAAKGVKELAEYLRENKKDTRHKKQ